MLRNHDFKRAFFVSKQHHTHELKNTHTLFRTKDGCKPKHTRFTSFFSSARGGDSSEGPGREKKKTQNVQGLVKVGGSRSRAFLKLNPSQTKNAEPTEYEIENLAALAPTVPRFQLGGLPSHVAVVFRLSYSATTFGAVRPLYVQHAVQFLSTPTDKAPSFGFSAFNSALAAPSSPAQ